MPGLFRRFARITALGVGRPGLFGLAGRARAAGFGGLGNRVCSGCRGPGGRGFGCRCRLRLCNDRWLRLCHGCGLWRRFGRCWRIRWPRPAVAPVIIAVAMARVALTPFIAVVAARPIFAARRGINQGFGCFNQTDFVVYSESGRCGNVGLITTACIHCAIIPPLAIVTAVPLIPVAVIALTVVVGVAVLIAVLTTGLTAILVAVLATILIAVLPGILGKLLLTRLLFGDHFALSFAQKTGVMLGVLREILGGNPVI